MPDWKSFSSAVPETLAIGLRRRRLVPNAATSAGRRRRAMGAGNCARRAKLTSRLHFFSPRSEIGIGKPRMDTEQPYPCSRGDRSAAFRPQKRPPAATVPNHPNTSPRRLVGESAETVREFARPFQDARFCGLKAALRLNSHRAAGSADRPAIARHPFYGHAVEASHPARRRPRAGSKMKRCLPDAL